MNTGEWEYCVTNLTPQDGTIERQLNFQGAAGWELVTATIAKDGVGQAIFKRLKTPFRYVSITQSTNP